MAAPGPSSTSPPASPHQYTPTAHHALAPVSPGTSPTATAPAGSTWTEPPWCGWIETTLDALLILEAARRGMIPRVTRRLVDAERKMITSGSVFVFDEDESGIKRWTDGFFWSPSRILGNFLLYRETDKRGAGHRGRTKDSAPSAAGNGSSSAGLSSPTAGGMGSMSSGLGAGGADLLVNEQPHHGHHYDIMSKEHQQSLARPKGENSPLDKNRERSLLGSLTNSYKFKPDGMMKKVVLMSDPAQANA